MTGVVCRRRNRCQLPQFDTAKNSPLTDGGYNCGRRWRHGWKTERQWRRCGWDGRGVAIYLVLVVSDEQWLEARRAGSTAHLLNPSSAVGSSCAPCSWPPPPSGQSGTSKVRELHFQRGPPAMRTGPIRCWRICVFINDQLLCTDVVICLYTTVPVTFRLPFLCIFTNLEVKERYLPTIRCAGTPFPCVPRNFNHCPHQLIVHSSRAGHVAPRFSCSSSASSTRNVRSNVVTCSWQRDTCRSSAIFRSSFTTLFTPCVTARDLTQQTIPVNLCSP